jgi:hypothetical protein
LKWTDVDAEKAQNPSAHKGEEKEDKKRNQAGAKGGFPAVLPIGAFGDGQEKRDIPQRVDDKEDQREGDQGEFEVGVQGKKSKRLWMLGFGFSVLGFGHRVPA